MVRWGRLVAGILVNQNHKYKRGDENGKFIRTRAAWGVSGFARFALEVSDTHLRVRYTGNPPIKILLASRVKTHIRDAIPDPLQERQARPV